MASSAIPAGQQGKGMEDLGPRLLSALILIPAAIGAALAGREWLAGAAGAAVVAMSYEYARMSEPKSVMPAFGFCLVGALGAVMAQSWGATSLAFLWLALCAIASSFRRPGLLAKLETGGGLLYVGTPCVLFLFVRAHDPGGLSAVLALFSIIWSADVAAYFAGRLIGGRKLLPQLSPGKTWAGTLAGVLAGVGAGLGCAASFGASPLMWGLVGATLAVVGLAGDLFESYLKRRFGVKDSSKLIPGHGGVLDRLDGLMAATAVVALTAALAPKFVASLAGATP